jgi:hypothetical protein
VGGIRDRLSPARSIIYSAAYWKIDVVNITGFPTGIVEKSQEKKSLRASCEQTFSVRA